MVESSNDYRGKIKKGRGAGGGGRDVIVNKEVRKGLTENITFEKGLKEVEKQATQRTGGRALQTEGTARAKALRQEQAWYVRGGQCGWRGYRGCGVGEEAKDEMGPVLQGPEGCAEDFGFHSAWDGSQRGWELEPDWRGSVVTGSICVE